MAQCDGARFAVKCECYLRRDTDRRLRRLGVRERDAVLSRLMPCSDMKKCFAPIELQHRAITQLQKRPDDSFAFFGPTGVGKSTYIAALYRHAVEKQRRGTFYVQMGDLLRELRDLEFGRDQCPYLTKRVIHELAEDGIRPRVFLDEFDKITATEFARNAVHDLIDFVYQLAGDNGKGAQLVVATNLSRQKFSDIWGAHVLRRIEAMAGDGGIFDYFEASRRCEDHA